MSDKAFLRFCTAGNDGAIAQALREGNYTENDVKNILISLNFAKQDVYYTWVVDYAIQKNYLTYMSMIVGNLDRMGHVQRAIELFVQYGPFSQPQRDLMVRQASPRLLEHLVQYSLSLERIIDCLKKPQHTIFLPAATQFRLAIGPFVQTIANDVDTVAGCFEEWNEDILEIFLQATRASDLVRLEKTVELLGEMNEVVAPVFEQIFEERRIYHLDKIWQMYEYAEESIPECVSVETAAFWLDYGGRPEDLNQQVFASLHTRYLIYSKVRRPESRQALLGYYTALAGYIQNLQTTMRLRTPLPTDMIKHIYDRYLHQG